MIEYLGIFLYFIIAFALAAIILGLAFVFATRKADPEKISAYECGFQRSQRQIFLLRCNLPLLGLCFSYLILKFYIYILQVLLFYYYKQQNCFTFQLSLPLLVLVYFMKYPVALLNLFFNLMKELSYQKLLPLFYSI